MLPFNDSEITIHTYEKITVFDNKFPLIFSRVIVARECSIYISDADDWETVAISVEEF